MIYFIQGGGCVKIGYSDKPERRLQDLQLATPYNLKLIKVIDGTYKSERALHKQFKKYRVRGEWYRCSPEVIGYIRGLRSAYGYSMKQPEFSNSSRLPKHYNTSTRPKRRSVRIKFNISPDSYELLDEYASFRGIHKGRALEEVLQYVKALGGAQLLIDDEK